MTRFFINDREITPPMDVSTLNQVLKYIEDTHLPPNTIVRKIQIDGLPLVMESFSDGQSDIFNQIDKKDKVEFFTGTVVEIARDSIAEALDYLNRIEIATPSLITSFQTSPGQEAYDNLKHLYEGFYWLSLLLGKLGANNQKFLATLKQLIDSQNQGDFVMISDLLEYEILPLVSVWREMFNIIEKKMNVAQ
jgi:hypothetical protein